MRDLGLLNESRWCKGISDLQKRFEELEANSLEILKRLNVSRNDYLSAQEYSDAT